MTEIGAFEAKTHLSRLLRRVQAGERFVITRHHRPVAELISFRSPAMVEYLRQFREQPPKWLLDGDITLDNFFESRTVFYPGSGNDGQAIAIFNASRSAHCFVYVDTKYNCDTFLDEIHRPEDFPRPERRDLRGYRLLNSHTFQAKELGWNDTSLWIESLGRKLILLAVYGRLPEFDENHGGRRLAVLFVGAEAKAFCKTIYGRLFRRSPPFAVLAENYMNMGSYGRGADFYNPQGPIAETIKPEFLLTIRKERIWPSYRKAGCRHINALTRPRLPRMLYERRT